VHGRLPAVAAGTEPAAVPPVRRGCRRGILKSLNQGLITD
jgi:hypothetical protein